jgi:enoyl-CoA hydratase/carnithine racemase
MLGPEEALAIGLVDELAESPEAVVNRAIEYCEMLVSLPSHAMLATRALVREDLHALFEDERDMGVDEFLELWFSDQTQQTLKAMVARLQQKA